jgi:glycosyltransferase involved in cell wall biosynthesis
MDITVSVVVPTFKRAGLLRRCIDALLVQTLDRSDYEIIIVDDAASEDTKRLVESYAVRTHLPLIRYLRTYGKHGPAAARNCGWKSARGTIISFTDDDCIPEPDWLARGTAAFRDSIAGVSGRVIVPCGNNPTDHERNTSLLENSEFVTANSFYRKKVLAEVGGFDERFTTAWREDADLFFTLLKRDYRLVRAPDAIVIHPVRRVHWGISIREQSKSRFNALLYKKHPDLYKLKIQNPVLSRYYGIVASSALFFLSIAAGIRFLGIITFLIWITLTFSLCMKRLQGTSHSIRHIFEMMVTSLVIPFLSVYWRLAGAVKFNVIFY